MMKTLLVKLTGRLISVSSSSLCILLCLLLVACSSRQIDEGGATQTGAPTQQTNSAQTAQSSQPQPAANVKTYRGSLNERGIEMKLVLEGERVSGYYENDGITHGSRLEGRIESGGKYEFTEKNDAGSQTGKWSCESSRPGERGEDLSCKWTKPDGSGELLVALFEQAAFASGLRVAPKTVENKKSGVHASYPEIIASDGEQLSASAAHFNQLLEKKVGDEAHGFADGLEGEKNVYFNVAYNVLLATDDLVSVELAYDSYMGGAHPDSSYSAVTYDLRADRELKLEDIFKPNAPYAKAVAAYCDKDIRRRAGVMEEETAKEEHRKAEPQDDTPVLPELLEEISAFALTPRGLMIYYDLPHVVAVFDRNFVPYSVVKNFLKPDSPAAQLAR
jgi:hypothetical protein